MFVCFISFTTLFQFVPTYYLCRFLFVPSINVSFSFVCPVIDHEFHGNINLLLTEREGRTGEYWPEMVAVQKRPRVNIPSTARAS